MIVNDMYIEVRENPLVYTRGLMTTYLNMSARYKMANPSGSFLLPLAHVHPM